MRAADLRPNPRNWRVHPPEQQDALRGVLAEVGYADALLARELPDGSLMLIDGHLRAETTPDAVVPVLVLDVDEAEADKILLTHDPLAAMATVRRSTCTHCSPKCKPKTRPCARMLDSLARNARTGSTAATTGRIAPRSEHARKLPGRRRMPATKTINKPCSNACARRATDAES